MREKSADYIKASQELMQQAHDEFAQGDFRQASEKAWGAAAQGVKALAEERGWHHDSHGLLFDVVGQVSDERRGRPVRVRFRAAQELHTNFYENWLEDYEVAESIAKVERLLPELERALRAEQPRFTPRTDRQRRRLERLNGGGH